MAEVAKKAAPKTAKKAPARKKPAAKKVAAKKPVARKTAPRKAAVKAKKAEQKLVDQAQENGRKMFLAGLGFYGKMFDEAETQLKDVQKRIEANRKKADKLYSELVKRGEKVEKNARKQFDDLELPELKLPEFDLNVEEQLEKAKARFNELRDGLKTAA